MNRLGDAQQYRAQVLAFYHLILLVPALVALTMTVHMKGMVPNIKLIDLADHLLDALNAGVAELEQLIALDADEMIVLPVAVRALVFSLTVPELMSYHQLAFDEQFERVVDRSAAHPRAFLFQPDVYLVGSHMITRRVNLLQHSETCGRLSLAPFSQVLRKNAPDLLQLLRGEGRLSVDLHA